MARLLLGVLCSSCLLGICGFKGVRRGPFQASLNDSTLANIVQLSRAVFYHTNANHYMKTRQKSFQRFEKPPVSPACGHLELDS